ncbi:hypothetical protein NQ152_02525 [Microbacterium sp. zg.B48]|uniref:hypothetical protein n=1 Tax=Microbacterium sp. zg.B48 TaxID=2969408 RepID=UPI00214C4492|nr:hypothetical protein [Microbacterium sp. zg.B48]MCR2762378.1 hypothetical protein [Microbacterium sp. zg.B48]
MPNDTRLSYRVFGTPGAERLVVLVGRGIAVTLDPHPTETAARDICVLAVALAGGEILDSGTYGSETPAESTASSLADLIHESLAAIQSARGGAVVRTAAVVAYRDGVDVALRAAVGLGSTVDSAALVAVAAPAAPLDRDDFGSLLGAVSAQTLILNGVGERSAGEADALWYQDQMPAARAEMVPVRNALTLPAVWGRVLAHVAPGTER